MNNTIGNVLASRYASKSIKNIWSPHGKIILEREFWIALMKAQREAGIEIPDEAISSYEKNINNVNLDSINARERELKHDVKARIEEFNALSGFQHIHKGMTSRDLTENVEQLQILKSLKLVKSQSIALLELVSGVIAKFSGVVIAGRTHNVVAQPTTLGRRFAMFAEELLFAVDRLDNLISRYPLRGLKGAVGTQQDQLTLLNGDDDKVSALEKAVVGHLGFNNLCSATGQVYPRSLDFDVISCLVQVVSAPANFATTLRLMAGHDLLTEGFLKGQVGSSAMPHKVNSRSSERVNGFCSILRGHLSMVASLVGDQWNEGDVSCSVVRRVCLPDSFYAMDSALNTTATILNNMQVFEGVCQSEVLRVAPYLATTTLLMEAVQKGGARESIHKVIKLHALESLRQVRTGEISSEQGENVFAQLLENDDKFPLSRSEIDDVIEGVSKLIGNANKQADTITSKVNSLLATNPESKGYFTSNVPEII